MQTPAPVLVTKTEDSSVLTTHQQILADANSLIQKGIKMKTTPKPTTSGKVKNMQYGANEAFELSHSQETLLSCLDPTVTDKTDYLKVRMRQTLPGFLVGLFQSNRNRPMSLEELINIISPFQECLRKMDGQKYKSTIHMSVRSGLYMKNLFLKDCMGHWRMNQAIAEKWEEQQYNHYS